MLQVRQIDATTFFVESETLQCSNPLCGKLVKKIPSEAVQFSEKQKVFLQSLGLLGEVEAALALLKHDSLLSDNETCIKCGYPLEIRWLTVDIASESGNGRCGCEYFPFLWARRNGEPVRCKHLVAARDFALDVAIRLQNRQQKQAKAHCEKF